MKTAFVTGGGSGIGRSIVRRLHADGFKVWIAELDDERARAVADEIGDAARIRALRCDVTDRSSVEAAVDAAYHEDGRIDVLSANAGVSSMRAFLELTDEDWDRNFAVNARGAFLTMQCAGRRMVRQERLPGERHRGKIVATASMAARQGAPFLAHYSASKFAVTGLVHAAAKELAPLGVTEVGWEASLRGMTPDEVIADYVGQTPLGRLEEPDDVAAVVSFLAGADADFLTGESVEVNGGAFIF
jgi:NAD(P)-dependent dehydrogenase (short-subunit alcohol dehydrogenase family)